MIVDERTKATSYHLIPEVSWIVKCSDSRGVLMDAAQMTAPPSDFFTEFYEPRCASGYRFLAGLRHRPYMKIQISRDVEAHFGCRSDLGDELETRHTARVGHLTGNRQNNIVLGEAVRLHCLQSNRDGLDRDGDISHYPEAGWLRIGSA